MYTNYFIIVGVLVFLMIIAIGCNRYIEQPEDIVKQYFNVKKWEDRLPLLLDSDVAERFTSLEAKNVDYSRINLLDVTRENGDDQAEIGDYVKI